LLRTKCNGGYNLNTDTARKVALEAATQCIPQHSWSLELTDTLGKKILILASCFETYLQNGYEEALKVVQENVTDFRDHRRSF